MKRYRTLFIALLVLAAAPAAWAEGIAQNVKRSTVAGVDLVTYKTKVKDVVTIYGAFPAGDAFAVKSGNPAIATLTSSMLDRGTQKHDKYAIAEQLQNVGASISFSVGPQTLAMGAAALKKDLPLVLGLIAEQLREPKFDAAEFDKARQEFIGGLRQALEDVDSRADDAMVQAVFPAGHPNRTPALQDLIAAGERATLDEVKAFHRQYYGPKRFTLVLVGDVDRAVVEKEVSRAFGGWQGGVDLLQAQPGTPMAGEKTIDMPEKTNVAVRVGQTTGVPYRAPGALALHVGTEILGSGFTGRLMSTVRDKEGLTYGIGSGIAKDGVTDGRWFVFANFAPQLLDKGMVSLRRELQKWWAEGITEEELAAKKESMIGAYEVSLATTGGMGNAILSAIQRGYPLTWLDEYPKALEALTREQVNTAIRTLLDPSKMVVVKVGAVSGKAAAKMK